MTYKRCPLCHITADRRIVKREDRDEPDSAGMTFTGPGDGEALNREAKITTVECVQFVPCGHEFPRSDIELLDSVAGRIAERQQELQDLDDLDTPESTLILNELGDLEDRLDNLRWKAQEGVVTDNDETVRGVISKTSDYYGTSPVQSVQMSMEDGSVDWDEATIDAVERGEIEHADLDPEQIFEKLTDHE